MAEVTDAQLAANRANAAKSTGPRTGEGRRRSSLNAIRHGLTGQTVVLPNEDMEAYLRHSKEIVDSLRPETPVERQLAQRWADQQWRLNRVPSITEAMLALDAEEEPGEGEGEPASADLDRALREGRAFRDRSQAFVNLTTYEQRIQRMQKETLKQLQELQAARRAQEQADKETALRLCAVNKAKGLPYDPKADGFVFSTEEIEQACERWERETEFAFTQTMTRRVEKKYADELNLDCVDLDDIKLGRFTIK